MTLLGDLLDECIYDVLHDVHKNVKQSYDICQICQTTCRHHGKPHLPPRSHVGWMHDDHLIRSFFLFLFLIVQKPGYDIYGKSYNVNTLPSYECVNCQKAIASTRYAPHLEKCLGLAGRQSSRVANRR